MNLSSHYIVIISYINYCFHSFPHQNSSPKVSQKIRSVDQVMRLFLNSLMASHYTENKIHTSFHVAVNPSDMIPFLCNLPSLPGYLSGLRTHQALSCLRIFMHAASLCLERSFFFLLAAHSYPEVLAKVSTPWKDPF